MKRKLLFIAISCFVILISCSAEDINNFASTPVNVGKPDTISNPDANDTTSKPGGDIEEPTIILKNIAVAHRGAWKKNNFPQNSIASLKEAIKLGCMGSEFDVWITADDSLVISHDEYFNGLLIETTNYKDLLKFKLSNGEKIPTLNEFFVISSNSTNKTKLFCEIKPFYKNGDRLKVSVQKIYDLIVKNKIESKVVVASLSFKAIALMQQMDKNIEYEYLSSDLNIEKLIASKVGIAYKYDYFSNNPDFIQLAKSKGVVLNVWTVNDSEMLKYFVMKKMDYITTDEPELLISYGE